MMIVILIPITVLVLQYSLRFAVVTVSNSTTQHSKLISKMSTKNIVAAYFVDYCLKGTTNWACADLNSY